MKTLILALSLFALPTFAQDVVIQKIYVKDGKQYVQIENISQEIRDLTLKLEQDIKSIEDSVIKEQEKPDATGQN